MGSRTAFRLPPSLSLRILVSAIMAMASPAVLPASPLSFDEALRIAGQTSPAVSATQSRIDAASHEVGPAGELPDPKLVLGLDNVPISGPDRFSLDRDFMTAQRVGLMQEFPNRDKRNARIAAARARVERSEVERRIAASTARREAAIAWIRRYSIERQLKDLAALFEENRLLEAAVRARLASGGGLAADVVMPRQEAALLAQRRDDLMAVRQQSIAALRRWVGDAADSPLAGPPPPIPVSRETLLNGLDRRPELAAYDAMERTLEAEAREAESMKKSDWALELAYQRRGRQFDDMVMLQVSFDLPLFAATRQDPRIAAKRAERAGVEADREAALREQLQRLDSDLADYERLSQALERARQTLVPLAREKVGLMLAGYRSGRTALTDVIAARRERIDAELKATALEGEWLEAAAKLHFASEETDGMEGTK